MASVSIRPRSIEGWNEKSNSASVCPVGSPEELERGADPPLLARLAFDLEQLIEEAMRGELVLDRRVEQLGK